MQEQLGHKISSKRAWKTADLNQYAAWKVVFSTIEFEQLENAATGLPADRRDWLTISKHELNAPELVDRIDAVAAEINSGYGFAKISGLDISEYALEHSKEEVQAKLRQGHARLLPFEDEAFDFVLSVNTLHNLYVDDLWASITEIERVSRGVKHITVEAYRNEQEKVNLLYWQLTCRAFHTPEEWQWLFEKVGYTGDYGCIFFE